MKGDSNTNIITAKKKAGKMSTTGLKKKTPIGPMGASTTIDEEVKVLLSVI